MADTTELCLSHGVAMGEVLLLLCALLAAVLAALAAWRRGRFVFSLRGVPGPHALPLFGNALQLTGSQEDFFQLLQQCAARYGPMFRLWVGTRPFIFVHSAEAVQPILNSTVHIDKSPDYRFVESWVGTGLVTSTGDKWRARRKLLTPSFHSRVLDEFLEPLHREALVLATKLAERCGGAPFDIVPYAKLAALDIICDTALGSHIGAQRDSNNAYVLAIDRITSIVQRRFITPWLKPDALFRLSALSRAQKHCVDIIHGFTGRVFKARKEEMERAAHSTPRPQEKSTRRRLALLDLLLDMSRQGANLSDADIREEVDTFTFAGHDTTASAFSWCMYMLGKHPEVQERVVEEWRQMRSGGGQLSVRNLVQLHYMECCIKEVLRLYPVVPLLARDIRSPVEVLGQQIPAGCTLLVNTFVLHRDARVFPEPERFDPERFTPESDLRRQPFAYIPFSAGSRNCIGQRFAMLELKVLLGTTLERFEVHSAEPAANLRLVSELVLSNTGGIKVSLTPRD